MAVSDWPRMAPWSLGRYGSAINIVAIAYAVLICIVLVMPPNQLAGLTFLGLLGFLAMLYVAEARRKYRGPKWSRAADPER
jgi:hypothetical protein